MGRYLVLWEADESKIPVDAEERKAGWLMALEMTREDIKSGRTKEYGGFVGQTKGFAISEGTEEELNRMTLKYVPFFRFNIIPVLSIDQLEAAVKTVG